MRSTQRTYRSLAAVSLGALAASLLFASGASAQLSTSTVRGQVSDAGAAEPGATITATEIASGFVSRARSGADGSYALVGLRPGTYRVQATTKDGETVTRNIVLQVGQTANLELAVQGATEVSEVVVTAAAPSTVAETRTSEISTNVSELQISTLPQNNRNFLNFAALAPGVRLSNDEFRKGFSAGASGAAGDNLMSGQVNVFIDGVSLKSGIQQGGIVGQDSSRGNPFSQLAVQEFRVSTQNFKAEYEQAGSSIITAVTRSGGNEFHGEIFGFYQDESMIERDYIVRRNGDEKPKQERKQYGISLGGPIVRDKLLFFGAYEVNDQVRANQVTAGGDAARQALVPLDLSQFEGSFSSPFKEELAFGKLTWRVSDAQTVELSGSYRTESDVRSFGGVTSREAAERIKNEVITAKAQHTFSGQGWLNEATFDVLASTFTPTSANPDLIGKDYQGVIRVGGRETSQRVKQTGYTFRDNLTFHDVNWHGSHVIKAGAKLSFQEYSVETAQFANPLFVFINDPARNLDFSFAAEARYGLGTPRVKADNVQFGLFIQDDWELTRKLTLNLGLRWDYETNANNNDFVTPPDAVAALRGLETVLQNQPGNFFHADDYISTGKNRDGFKGAFPQPRIGISYDVFDNQRTVLFAGYGRYYDRTLFRNAAEESLFRQFTLRTFLFSRDGQPRDNQATIIWNPSFLSKAGLDALIASNLAPNGELRVLRNDQKPPHTDQFSIGIRQRLGEWQTALTLTHQRGYNEIGYFPANRTTTRNPGGFLDFIPVQSFGNVVAATDDVSTRFFGVYVTAEKPYTKASGWGATLAYTYSDAKQRGYTFNFDFPNVAEQPFYPNAADEEHRLVVSGIVDLPWGLQLSTLGTFASGQPFFVIDASQGFGRNLKLGHFDDGDPFAQIDLRLSRDFELFNGTKLQVIAEVFNVFNYDNLGGYDGFIPQLPEMNTNYGRPGGLSGPPRSFQLGLRYRW